MNISLNWIKEFVNLPNVDVDDLANSFTMTTAEVEGVETTNLHLTEIKIAQIKSFKKHPEADKLNLVTFDFGAGETKEVVCGAPNVREGIKIPYAPLGVTLPNGLTLEPKKIRGYLSEGMLCSAVELGIGQESNGIMELPDDAPIGMTMKEFFKIDSDTIIDVDNKSLTHRPDLWGHYGLAREFAVAYNVNLKTPFNNEWVSKIESLFTTETSPIIPKVDKDSSCKAYWGISLDGVKVGDSPQWLIDKIEACGLRSINNIVDISNYVMLELGIPLHIFDRDKIGDNTIHIKRVGEDSSFTTLDEVERKLLSSDTVISNSSEPLVLAGIMGGLNSGVDENTTRIFIEVANWCNDEVRKVSTRLGLRTDSSARYEKSLDSKQCYQTLLRTLDLVLQLSPKAEVLGRPEYDGDNLEDIKPLIINTSYKKICNTLGKVIDNSEINRIFEGLEFLVESNGDSITLTIPTFRTSKDIENEADIVEEVGRIIGYDNINPVSPTSEVLPTALSNAKIIHRKTQDFMSLNGQSLEVMTYPLIGEKLLKKSAWPTDNDELSLINALSKDADRMRPSLIPHALEVAALNAKNFDSFSFFEYGRAYLPDNKNFSKESNQILVAYYDKKESTFIKLIDTVESLMKHLKIPYDLLTDSGKFNNEVIPRDWSGSHPFEYMNIRIMGKFQGAMTTIHPLVLKSFKTKGNLSIAVIDLGLVEQRAPKPKNNYKPIAKFPVVKFDCTVVMSQDQIAQGALDSLKKLKIKEYTGTNIVDVFHMDDGQKSLTLSSSFEDPSKTLEGDFIKQCEEKIVDTLKQAGYPLKS